MTLRSATAPLLTLLLAAASAPAQENAPMGLLHGDLLAWTGTPRAGQFTFRTAAPAIWADTGPEVAARILD